MKMMMVMMTSEVVALAWEPETRSGTTLFTEQWPCLPPHWAFHLFPHYFLVSCWCTLHCFYSNQYTDEGHQHLLDLTAQKAWTGISFWISNPNQCHKGPLVVCHIEQKAKNIIMSFVNKCHVNLIHNWHVVNKTWPQILIRWHQKLISWHQFKSGNKN